MQPAIRDCIVLDIDDTLYLERDYAESGFRAVDTYLVRELGFHGFAEAASQAFAAGARGRIFNDVLSERGVNPSDKLIESLVAVYRSHDPAIVLADDARRFISRIARRRGIAILSDGFLVAQRAKVRALGLDRLGIEPIILTDEMGRAWWKPHEKGFRRIQDHYALPPSRFVYIADNPAKDFVAPQRLGWRSVRIRREGGIHLSICCDPPTDLTISSFDELSDGALDCLFERPILPESIESQAGSPEIFP